jgi:hypothetical protein
MATDAAMPTVNGERYEVVKARVDLLESEAEIAAATTSSELVMALVRMGRGAGRARVPDVDPAELAR